MASLVLFAADVGRTAAFYRAVGLRLADEEHGAGPVHFAVELGPVHVAIYPAESPGRAPVGRGGGSSFPGFYVESLDTAERAVRGLAAPVLIEHERMPWGCRIVIEDPDGRPVEINQRGHCPPTRLAGP